MSNMMTRALSGAVYVALLSLCLYLGSWFWMALLTVLFLLASFEYFKAQQPESGFLEHTNSIAMITIWFAASLAGHYYFLDYFERLGTYKVALPAGYIFAFILSIPIILLLAYFEIRKGEKARINRLQFQVFGLFYIGFGLLSMGFLRHNALINSESTDQIILSFATIIGIWVSDTFAYLSGRMLGKRKLSPHISPNKTIEGFAGGLIVTVVFEILFLSVFNSTSTWYIAAIFGALLACTTTLGDLVQSLWKRNMGIKDSGTLIPGHGGILDRIDGVLLAAPFSLFFWIIVNNMFQ